MMPTAVGRSPSPSYGNISQEPFYSNEDIEILHDVVAAAQDQLVLAPDLKPLPAAALFKAYDDVLPQYGIDPDSDNHLSRLIFRIGGEQGSGSLTEKFQAILNRMGIVLEFGDNSTVSIDIPEQYPTAVEDRHGFKTPLSSNFHRATTEVPPRSAAGESPANASEHVSTWLTRGEAILQASGNEDPREHKENAVSEYNLSKITEVEDVATQPAPSSQQLNQARPSALQHPALISILDRWRGLSAAKATSQESEPTYRIPTEPIRLAQNDQSHIDASLNIQNLHNDGPLATEHSPDAETTDLRSVRRVSASEAPLNSKPILPSENVTRLNNESWERAARAREIYLASKMFSTWVEKTARRLEREAVARRHMIRFRCFQGWSRTPTSRAPAIDHLRSLTAAQKLQRAVASHEAQLRDAANAIAQSHRLKLAQKALRYWIGDNRQQVARKEVIGRARLNILSWWASQTSAADDLSKSGERMKRRHCLQASLGSWVNQTEGNMKCDMMGRQVALIRPLSACLLNWQAQAEIHRRAQAYRFKYEITKGLRMLSSWGLQARERAFIWNTEYHSCTQTLDHWRSNLKAVQRIETIAVSHHQRISATRHLSMMRESGRQQLLLSQYSSRACLFIMANKFLNVVQTAHDESIKQQKLEIRKQLRQRYKEVSSRRKRTQFFSALNRWQALSYRQNLQGEKDSKYQKQNTYHSLVRTCSRWHDYTLQDDDSRHTAGLYRLNGWLNALIDGVATLQLQRLQAESEWTLQQQHHYLRNWSKSSLQNSGHEHTAAMVQQRHISDSRNRAIQHWQRLTQNTKNTSVAVAAYSAPSTSRPEIGSAFRSSWRPTSNKSRHKAQFQNLQITPLAQMETPTRWTGNALPMTSSFLAHRMPAVRETDEQSTATTSVEGDSPGAEEELASSRPLKWNQSQGILLTAASTSTTPRAPVPTYLQRAPFRAPQVGSIGGRQSHDDHVAPSRTLTSTRTLALQPAPTPISSSPRSPKHRARLFGALKSQGASSSSFNTPGQHHQLQTQSVRGRTETVQHQTVLSQSEKPNRKRGAL